MPLEGARSQAGESQQNPVDLGPEGEGNQNKAQVWLVIPGLGEQLAASPQVPPGLSGSHPPAALGPASLARGPGCKCLRAPTPWVFWLHAARVTLQSYSIDLLELLEEVREQSPPGRTGLRQQQVGAGPGILQVNGGCCCVQLSP